MACLCVLREGTFVRLAQGTQLEPLSIHIKESRARACVCVCVCVCVVLSRHVWDNGAKRALFAPAKAARFAPVLTHAIMKMLKSCTS